MFRSVLRSTGTLCAAVIAPDTFNDLPQKPRGWDKVKTLFTTDEFGNLTPELVCILQTGFFSGFVGAMYGGFMHSREAYLRFIERNDASKFSDHMEAKRKLQDRVTISFAKGAFKWSWRIGLFGTLYVGFLTVFTAYHGDAGILDFCTAGAVAGGLCRINYGFKGLIAGSVVGSMMGFCAGSLTTGVLKLTGANFDDIYDWQSSPYQSRQRVVKELIRTSAYSDSTHETALKEHDKLAESNLSPVSPS